LRETARRQRLRGQLKPRNGDAYYSSPTALGGDLNFNISNDPISFVNYYRNLDLFRGGVVELYFNAQIDFLPALKSWSRMAPLFDLAEDVNNNTVVQVLLSLIDLPTEIANELLYGATVGVTQGVNDITSLATFGYLQCFPENSIRVFGRQLSFTDSLREGLQWLGGMNERIAAHSERARVARYNWTRLSECIGESFAKAEAAPFDKNNPGVNTDPCADIVRAGWQDEGHPNGLYRGNIRPFTLLGKTFIDPADAEFLMDLKGSFLGSNPDTIYEKIPESWRGDAPYHTDQAYEENNQHRSPGRNFERLLTYLRFPGTTLGDVGNVILPSSSSSGPSALDELNAVCADARNSGFEHCLDVATLPIAAAAREAVCLKDWAECSATAIGECVSEACDVACHSVVGFNCNSACGQSTGCQGWCDSNLCEDVGVTVCLPVAYQACSLMCQVVGDPHSSCLQDGKDVAVCGAKEIKCSLDDIKKTLELEGFGNAILSPVRKVCDEVDEVRAFFACVKGDPNMSDADNMTARHKCIVKECNKAISEAGSNLPPQLRGFNCEASYTQIENAWNEVQRVKDAWGSLITAALQNPETFVNVVFIQNDAAKDPAYKKTILDTAAAKRDALVKNPPPSTASAQDKQLWQDQITALDAITAAANGAPTPMGLDAVRLGPALQALAQQPWPQVQGPTVKQIISDMGTDFNTSFTPVFNAVQGTKLTPMMSSTDIVGMFNTANVSTALLPSSFPATSDPFYSSICHTAPFTSIYCDVLSSFDDPNCKGPECLTGTKDDNFVDYRVPLSSSNPAGPRNGWIPGRGIVAFNPFDATKTTQNVLTNFPLAATQETYDKLYTRVFRVRRPRPTPKSLLAGVDDAKTAGLINAGLANNLHNELTTAMAQAASGNLVGEDGTLNLVLNQLIEAREEQCAPPGTPSCRQIDDATAARLIVDAAELVATDSFTDADYLADPPTLKAMEAIDQAFAAGKLSIEILEITVHDAAAAVVSEHKKQLPDASRHLVDTVEDLLASVLRTCSPNPSCPLADKVTAETLVGQVAELAASIALPAAGLPAAQPVRALLVELDGDLAGGLVTASLYDSLRKNLHDAIAAAAATQKTNERNILKAMQTTLEAALAHPCTTKPLDNCFNFNPAAGNKLDSELKGLITTL
jgi:hypothetical protein